MVQPKRINSSTNWSVQAWFFSKHELVMKTYYSTSRKRGCSMAVDIPEQMWKTFGATREWSGSMLEIGRAYIFCENRVYLVQKSRSNFGPIRHLKAKISNTDQGQERARLPRNVPSWCSVSLNVFGQQSLRTRGNTSIFSWTKGFKRSLVVNAGRISTRTTSTSVTSAI